MVISGLTYVVSGLFFGLISLILQLLIVYYCLGPNNVFFPVVSDTKDNVGEYLVDANSQVFAVIFWYLLLGVFGVIAYRLISVCKSYSVTSAIAGKVADVLDWIPARITSLFYLLVGNFQHGFPVLMQFLSKGPDNNAQLLNQCGVATLNSTPDNQVTIGQAQTHVEHAILLWVFLLAIYTFVV